jgi:hypothetical protein
MPWCVGAGDRPLAFTKMPGHRTRAYGWQRSLVQEIVARWCGVPAGGSAGPLLRRLDFLLQVALDHGADVPADDVG